MTKKEYGRQYYLKNKDKIKQYQNEYQKQYYLKNKKKINIRHKQHRQDNKEYFKQYYIDNKNTIITYQKQYTEDHLNEKKEYDVKYRIDNKEIRYKHEAKRRRELGYISLNSRFEGCHGHHINKLYVINIPAQMHSDNRHRLTNVESMNIINELAINFLNEQRS